MRCIVTILAAATLAGSATADLVNPDVPDWRGDVGSSYAEFDTFTNAVGAPNFPDVSPGAPSFQLFNYGQGAIIASSGNIYNPAGALDIHLYSIAPLNTPTQAVLNVSWGGTMMDTSDVRAFFDGNYYDAASVELRDSQESPFGGTTDTWAFTFDLTGAFGVGDLAFFFGNDGPHGSLDAVSIDVLASPIPAPGVVALLGLAGLVSRRRRS